MPPPQSSVPGAKVLVPSRATSVTSWLCSVNCAEVYTPAWARLQVNQSWSNLSPEGLAFPFPVTRTALAPHHLLTLRCSVRAVAFVPVRSYVVKDAFIYLRGRPNRREGVCALRGERAGGDGDS